MARFFKIFVVFVLVVSLALFALSRTENGGAAIVNGITPSSSFTLEKDVSFGNHTRDKVDYYMSTDVGASDRPLIVFIHGGGWHRGDKSMYKFLAEGLTSEGYDVALPNYRLYPEVKYPEFLLDNARAIAAIHKRFPSRYLVLMGHSAGAYNVMMMAFKPQYLEAEGVYSCYTVRGVISLAGPTGAFPMTDDPYTTIFPDLMQGDDAVLAHTNQPLPPLMLANGDADSSVSHINALKLGEALNGRNIATVKIYEGADHTDTVKWFSRHFDHEGALKADVIDFIENLPADQGDGFCK